MKLKLPPNWRDSVAGIQLDDSNAYAVGQMGVTRIEPEVMDLGRYGIAWFRVYCGDNLVARVNANLIKAVIYATA